MERSIEVLATILFGVIGLSHLLQPRAWAYVIKSLIRFCIPQMGLRMMARVSLERSWEFQVAGAGLLVIAGLIGYGAYSGQ